MLDGQAVTNGGETPVAGLTVVFPDDRLTFGEVAPGAVNPLGSALESVTLIDVTRDR